MSEIEEEIKAALSHGSGIDADWYVDDMGNYIRATNSYHCMDDVGFYEGWVDFSLIIPKKDPTEFRLHFHGDQYLARKHALREYLEDTFADNIQTLLSKKEKGEKKNEEGGT